MSDTSRELLLRFVTFAEATCKGVQPDAAVNLTSPEARAFLERLQHFNEDPTVADNAPFFFMPGSILEPLVPEGVIDKIMMRAATAGLGQHLVKLQHLHGPSLHFTHHARDFALEEAQQFGLRAVNLGANGLCLKWFSCVGLYGAPARRIAMAANEIKTILAYGAI